MRHGILQSITCTLLIWCSSSSADEIDKAARALKIISETADSICNTVPTKGKSTTSELSGVAKAETAKLVKQLAELKIQGAGKIESTEYEGFLQKDLVAAMQNNATCKQNVFNILQTKLIPKPLANLNDSSSQKLALAVAECADANFDKADQIFNELKVTSHQHPRVIAAATTCNNSRRSIKTISVNLLQSPAIFQEGLLTNRFYTILAVNFDGVYCGRLSNLYGARYQGCDLAPGTHSFQLRYLSIHVRGKDSESTVYQSEGDPYGQTSCSGTVKVRPTDAEFTIAVCLDKNSQVVGCSVNPNSQVSTKVSSDTCAFA